MASAVALAFFGIGWVLGDKGAESGNPSEESTVTEEVAVSTPAVAVASHSGSLMAKLADAEPPGLQAIFEALGELPWKERIARRRIVVARWIGVDLEGARAYFEADEKGIDRKLFYEHWAKIDPEGALNTTDETQLLSVLKGVAEVDPDRCLEFLRSQGVKPGESTLRHVYMILAQSRPAEAAEVAASMVGKRRGMVLGSIAEEWARTDPRAAVEWGLANGRQGVDDAFKVWAKRDPVAMAEFVAGLEQDSMKDGATRMVFESWAKDDPGAAIAWMHANIKEGKWASICESAITRAGAKDVRNSMMLADQIPEEARGSLRLYSVGGYWGINDPQHVVDWLLERPPEPWLAKTKFLQQFADNWARFDSEKAVAFVPSLPEGAVRDDYVNGLLKALGERDPASAEFIKKRWLNDPDSKLGS